MVLDRTIVSRGYLGFPISRPFGEFRGPLGMSVINSCGVGCVASDPQAY